LISKAFLAMGHPLPQGLRRFYISRLYEKATQGHVVIPYAGPVILNLSDTKQDTRDWKALFPNTIDIHYINSQHMSLLEEPALVRQWAGHLAVNLDRINAKAHKN
jgi:thioesterase domain-containing protein